MTLVDDLELVWCKRGFEPRPNLRNARAVHRSLWIIRGEGEPRGYLSDRDS
jgi:hypothetical protein